MTESATTGREARRRDTMRRIQVHASELTLEHGLDGWTMDDLATATDVSRRTLFNYVPSKLDAVIGEAPELPAAELAVFRAGGPTGHLLEDIRVLARTFLADEDLDLDLHVATLRRELLTREPRLMSAVHERFEQVSNDVTTHVLAREGAAYGTWRARLVVRVLVALFDGCVQHLADDPDETRTFPELFDAAVDDVRHLFT